MACPMRLPEHRDNDIVSLDSHRGGVMGRRVQVSSSSRIAIMIHMSPPYLCPRASTSRIYDSLSTRRIRELIARL